MDSEAPAVGAGDLPQLAGDVRVEGLAADPPTPVVVPHGAGGVHPRVRPQAQHVLKRGDILDAVWGYTFYGSDRVVDDTIRRLRKKLPGIEISTLYGLGYCLTEERHESLCD